MQVESNLNKHMLAFQSIIRKGDLLSQVNRESTKGLGKGQGQGQGQPKYQTTDFPQKVRVSGLLHVRDCCYTQEVKDDKTLSQPQGEKNI